MGKSLGTVGLLTGFVLAGLAFSARAGAQSWQAVVPLNRPGQPADDSFGFNVAASGTDVLVGAINEDGAQPRSGAAYVFSGTQWGSVARLAPDVEESYSSFGIAVALDGDTAFIGTGKLEKSPTYVFSKSGGSWALSQTLREDGSDTFGDRIVLRGNVAMLAAPKDSADIGKIHVYGKSGASWTEQQELTANDGASGDFFALGLDFDGESVIASEPATNSLSPQPAAYIFAKSGTGFAQQAKLNLTQVGTAVTISGDTAAVGSLTPSTGAVTIYTRSANTWSMTQLLTMPSEERFGSLVRLQGETLFVSAGSGGQSSVYVFRRNAQVWAQTQQLSAPPAMFGPSSLAVSGGTLAVGISGDKLSGAVQVFRNPAEDAALDTPAAGNAGSADKKDSGCSFSASTPRRPAAWLLLGCTLLLLRTRRRSSLRSSRSALGGRTPL